MKNANFATNAKAKVLVNSVQHTACFVGAEYVHKKGKKGKQGRKMKWRDIPQTSCEQLDMLTAYMDSSEFNNRPYQSKDLRNIDCKLSVSDIVWYVLSFLYTHCDGYPNKSKTIVMDERTIELSSSKDKYLQYLLKAWKNEKTAFLHVPVLMGKNVHLAGLTVEIQKRRIIFYDSKKMYGGGQLTNIEGLMGQMKMTYCKSNDKWDDLLASDVEALGDKLKGWESLFANGREQQKYDLTRDKILFVYKKCLQLDKESGRLTCPWSFTIVNDFIKQENDVDCGVFVCYFFHCKSMRVDTKMEKYCRDHGFKLGQLRQWIAFSILVAYENNDGNFPYSIKDEEVVSLEMTDDECMQTPIQQMVRKRSERTKPSALSMPMVYSTSNFDGDKNLQYNQEFLVHTHLGNESGGKDLKWSYSTTEESNPMKLTERRFEEVIDGNVSGELIQNISNLKEVGIIPNRYTPYHLWVNPKGKSCQWTTLHSDPNSIMFVQLRGHKMIYVGSNPPDGKDQFVDALERIWSKVPNDSSRSEMWQLDNGADCDESVIGEIDEIIHSKCFQRFHLGPGEALLLPKRYLHAVHTPADSVMVSITLKS